MSRFELKLPRMGESVAEATLTVWLKQVGDKVLMDEPVFEIATDKVDSEVPSEVAGILVERLFEVDDVVKVGDTVAIIEVAGTDQGATSPREVQAVSQGAVQEVVNTVAIAKDVSAPTLAQNGDVDRFYSPLVKNIAKQEGISLNELQAIKGTGTDGRLTKNDLLAYLQSIKKGQATTLAETPVPVQIPEKIQKPVENKPMARQDAHQVSRVQTVGGDEVIEMGRMGKLIAKHMVESKSTSAHVQSFIEVDVTKIVRWRNKMKDAFEENEGVKLTFTPIFMEAVAKALKKFPMMNISVSGETIIKKKNINIGMATALPDGNLIVPVIKNADQLNLVGMAKVVNDLAFRARENKLKPDEVQDGTYTVTNVGTFGSVFGTPIINQPQVGILALGAIRKVPSVIETAQGDFIGIRSKMYLSHSYDHRVVNGALGSMFAKSVADYLENWDEKREL